MVPLVAYHREPPGAPSNHFAALLYLRIVLFHGFSYTAIQELRYYTYAVAFYNTTSYNHIVTRSQPQGNELNGNFVFLLSYQRPFVVRLAFIFPS